VGAGIARTVYLAAGVDPYQSDKTWIAFNGYVAGLAEANLGLICACAPSLNRLSGRYFGSASVNGNTYDSDSKSALERNERPPHTMQCDQRSESLGAVDELEVDMRLYSKPFVDGDNAATNTTQASASNTLN
jgi:hypothetical protein